MIGFLLSFKSFQAQCIIAQIGYSGHNMAAISPQFMPMHISNYTPPRSPLLLILVRIMTVKTVNEVHAWVNEAHACFNEDTGIIYTDMVHSKNTCYILLAPLADQTREYMSGTPTTKLWTCRVDNCSQGQAMTPLTRITVLNKKPCLPHLLLAARAQPALLAKNKSSLNLNEPSLQL